MARNNSAVAFNSLLMARRRLLQLPLALFASNFSAASVGYCDAPQAPIQRRLRFTLSFSNPSNQQLGPQTFWCYLPASELSGQHLRGLTVSMPYQLQTDRLHHNILQLEFEQLPPLAQKIVSVTAEVECRQLTQTESPAALSDYLLPERFIESDSAPVRMLAKQLRQSNPAATARAIYDWVRSNLHYAGYIAQDLGAVQALAQHSGDCTEYADLVVALARANGIPARMLGGYVTDHDIALRSLDYHNWAELYFNDGWRLVDAQKEHWLESASQYIGFRIYRDTVLNAVGNAHRYRVDGAMLVSW